MRQTETHDLGSTSFGDCRSRIFGHMAEMAWSIVRSYKSDLYHDAAFLAELVPDDAGTVWYYGVRETGTSIAVDRDGYEALRSVFGHNEWAKMIARRRPSSYSVPIDAWYWELIVCDPDSDDWAHL